jgi:MFS family permease
MEGITTDRLSTQARGLSLRETIRTEQFWTLCTVFGCLFFCSGAISTHIVLHALDLGIPAINAANILAIGGGIGIAGRILMGSLADRFGEKSALLVSSTLILISFLWILVAKEMWALNLFAVILGFGTAGLSTLGSPLMAKLFGLGSLSVIMGSVEFVGTALGSPSAAVTGYIFDVTGSYQIAFLICAGISALGLMLSLLFIKPITPKGKK